ncbi:toll/interleukin-1 receptor domain-containing adapter protein [Lithobates pipiens]
MNWTRICDGRGVRSRRALKMGGNESKPASTSSCNLPRRPVPTRTIMPAPERVLVWPKNSARWQKLYDVYICSSEKDISYANALLLYLQKQPESLRCFLPMRDMNPGGAIPTEMTNGAENSHCWIMLLTSSFLSDPWCQYQMQQFLALAPYGNGSLIPVLVELPFQYYPKELRHMFAFRDVHSDKKVFEQLRKAIVSYLSALPTVTTHQDDSKEETNGNTSERSSSSSLLGINSQVTSSHTLEPTSDTSVISSGTQGSTGYTPLRSSMTQESTNISSVRNDINQEATRDTSVESFLTQEAASNALKSASNTSVRSFNVQTSTSNISVKSSVNQETISEASLKSSYTEASASNTSGRGSQEFPNNQSVRTSIPQELSTTSSVTQRSICNIFMESPMTQDSISETCLPKPSMNLSLWNYDTLISDTNILAINCKTMDSNTSRICAENELQEYAISKKVDRGSFKKEETSNIDYHGLESNFSASTNNSTKQSTISTSCGGAQMIRDTEILQGDIYTSCGGTNAEIKDPLDPWRDIHTSCRTKGDNEFQSSQSNIYTSCAGAKTENKDSGSNQYTYSGLQAGKRDTLSQLSNIYTSSVRVKDVQKDRYTMYDEAEAKEGDCKIFPEDLYASYGGMRTGKGDSPSYPCDIYTSWDGKQAQMNAQSLQTDMYTSFKGNRREKKTSDSFQSDLYTSYRGTPTELKNAQMLEGEMTIGCGGLQASNKISSSDGRKMVKKNHQALCSDLYFSGTTAQTMGQNISVLQSNVCTDCAVTQAEDKDSDNSISNLYASCTGTKAFGSDS